MQWSLFVADLIDFPQVGANPVRKGSGRVKTLPYGVEYTWCECINSSGLSDRRRPQGIAPTRKICPIPYKKGAPSGAPSSLAAAAVVALAAVPVTVAVAAAVAEDQQEDDDPPPVVAAEAPADPIVICTHNRYLRSFCWASLPTLHVMTAAIFCATGDSAG